jgi:hypothetical protein
MPPIRHRPPLTREQLHAIGERNRGKVDVRALLWEIHRLRAVALRADQLVRSLPGPSVGSLGFITDALRDQLENEPVVLESARPRSMVFRPVLPLGALEKRTFPSRTKVQ